MSRQKKLLFILIISALLLAFAAPSGLAQDKGRPVTSVSPFPSESQQQDEPDGSSGGTRSVGTSGIAGAANWLLAQQDTSGGFPWTPGGSLTTNTQGPSAQGLLKAYQHDGDSDYRDAAIATGDYLVPTYPITYTDGDPRFATHDPLFLEDLTLVTGDDTYAAFAQTYFWDKLAADTYGESNDMDAADFGAAVVNGRAAQSIVEISPWDLSATAIAAHTAGETAARDALMGAILDGLEATTAGDTYDVIGLAGAVWASAVTGFDLDPTAGAYASAGSTGDLAATLSGMTLDANDGAWLWNSTVDATDSSNADTQTTAFAIMALNAYDPVTYASQIAHGAAFIRSLQHSSGQFLGWPGDLPAGNGSVEVQAEALTALVTVAPDTVCVDDDFVGSSAGDAADGAGCGMGSLTFGYDAFDNIRDGIDGVGNSTVNVAAGTYDESVVIHKALTLQGAGAASTSIAPSAGPAVLLRADDVTLDGFTLTSSNSWGVDIDAGSGTPLPVGGVHNTLVQNCIFSGSHQEGLYIGYGATVSNLTVSGCTFTGNLNGIGISGAGTTVDGLTIENSSADNNRNHGLYINGATLTDLSIQGSDFADNANEGLYIGAGATVNSVTVSGCTFTSNDLNGMSVSGTGTTVDGLTIENSSADSNGNHGLYLNGATITDLLIQDSDLTGNTHEGIHIAGAHVDPFTMQGGTITGNATGLAVRNGATFGAFTLDGVTVQNNSESGVMLGGGSSATALTLQDSYFQSNAWEEIDISGGWFGAFSVSGETNITGNVFGGGPWAAIYIGDQVSFGNTARIYNNDLSGYGSAVYNASSTLVDASGNWWGTSDAATVRARANGGAYVDYTPWLDSGTNNAAGIGFDGDFTVLWVDDDSPQAGATTRIQQGVDMVSGNTVNVLGGTYAENVIIDKDDLLVQSVPTHAAVLDGSGQLNDYYGNKGFWIQGDRQNVIIDGFEITGYPEGPEDGAGIFAGSTASGPSFPGTVHNIILRNNIIHGNGNDGIQIDKADDGEHTDIHILDNEIYNHQNDENMSASIKMYDATDGLIAGNMIYLNERGILFYQDVVSTTIEYNHIYSTTSTVNGEGIKLDDESNYNVVRYNYVYDNPDDGIRLDDDSNHNQIYHNTVYNNAGSGIFIEDASVDNVVRDNIIALSGEYGIEEESTTGPHNTEFSNLFYGNAQGDFDPNYAVSEDDDIMADPIFLLPVRPTFTPSCDPLSPAESTASDTDGAGYPLDRGATQVDCTSLTIIKEAPGAKAWQSFDFDGDLGEFSLAHGERQRHANLEPGEYDVFEDPISFPSNCWSLLSVTCVDELEQPVPGLIVSLNHYSATITLEAGRDVVCTFFNERVNLEVDEYRVYLPMAIRN